MEDIALDSENATKELTKTNSCSWNSEFITPFPNLLPNSIYSLLIFLSKQYNHVLEKKNKKQTAYKKNDTCSTPQGKDCNKKVTSLFLIPLSDQTEQNEFLLS